MVNIFAGYLLGVVLMTSLLTYIPGTVIFEHNSLKEKCEQTLPRNQSCVMQFVPQPIEKNQ